jgi:hypothetical protein
MENDPALRGLPAERQAKKTSGGTPSSTSPGTFVKWPTANAAAAVRMSAGVAC